MEIKMKYHYVWFILGALGVISCFYQFLKIRQGKCVYFYYTGINCGDDAYFALAIFAVVSALSFVFGVTAYRTYKKENGR